MKICKNFNYLKTKNNYTFRDIQRDTKISLGTLHTIAMNENRDVAISTVIKLATIFQVSLDDFVLCDIELKHMND